jgi:hypothetical protein
MALDFLGRLARARRLATGGNSNNETTVLRAGELGFVHDTGDLRVGDGTTGFNNLKSVRNHRRIRTVSTTQTLESNDEAVVVTSGTITLTFPAAAAANAGRVVLVTNKGAGTVTISGTASAITSLAGAGTSGRYLSDGSAWLAA